MKKYCKLVMVTGGNNNKYYEMEYDGVSSNFNVKYGRIESTAVTTSYPISKWQTKYNEKVNKGYKDMTHLVTVQASTSKVDDTPLGKIADSKVDQFLNLMKRYTDKLVSTTYSVKFDSVTQAQVDEAQKLIDELGKLDKSNINKVNQTLVDLYMVIPRFMSNVTHYLLPNIDLTKTIGQEQDNLDAMASQVKMYKPDKKEAKKAKNLMDMLGLTMKQTTVNPETQYLIDQCGRKNYTIFEVDKPAENKVFEGWMGKQKNKQTRVLIHGTRCTSVIPILKTNLQIRPAGNFQFSGKAYGDGNYFSETVVKSLGYTGHDDDQILLVYEVHVGNPFTYDGWFKGNSFKLCYPELSSRGYDSTFVKAGGGLLNTEIIAYKEDQNRIKYIIWLKR